MHLDPLKVPEADALRGAVAADPDSDEPRLAYADWLDDHGNEIWRARAEFIRLSVAATGKSNHSKQVVLPLAADRLLLSFYQYWWLEVPDWLRHAEQGATPAPTQGYRRGFISQLLRSGELWAKGLDQPVRLPLDHVEIWYRKGRGDPLTLSHVPQLSSVRDLTVCFDSHCVGELAESLGASPYAKRLRALTLWGPCQPMSAAKIATAWGLKELRKLVLKVNAHAVAPVGPLKRLIQPDSALDNLEELEIHGVGTTEELLEFVKSPGMKRIRSLVLSGREVTNAVAQAISESHFVHQLRSLTLKETRVNDSGIESLISHSLGGLQSLDLQGYYGWWSGSPAPLGRNLRQKIRGRYPFVLLD